MVGAVLLEYDRRSIAERTCKQNLNHYFTQSYSFKRMIFHWEQTTKKKRNKLNIGQWNLFTTMILHFYVIVFATNNNFQCYCVSDQSEFVYRCMAYIIYYLKDH